MRAEIAALLELSARLISHSPRSAAQLRTWQATAERLLLESISVDHLYELTADLRRRWLQFAHACAASSYRSPYAGDQNALPGGDVVPYGYERELTPHHLEQRAAAFLGPLPARAAQHFVFSSGQAALAALVSVLAGRAGRPLKVAHIGGYFESVELVELLGARLQRTSETDPHLAEYDLLILEPVYYSDGFRTVDLRQLAATLARCGGPACVLVDATLCHRRFPFQALAAALPPATPVMRASSLLKLDQAGLELAPAGLLSVFEETPSLSVAISRMRAVAGAGVLFADLCALDAPFILDPDYASTYSDAVFANNARLAASIKSAKYGVRHPATSGASPTWAVAPYVIMQSDNASAHDWRRIADEIERRAVDLPLRRGGSFGFRTHRFDVVEPKDGPPFMRIAMGAASLGVAGTIDLLRAVFV